MIPQFILDTCASHGHYDDGNAVYWFKTKDGDGWVVYWPHDDETLHTYRNPREFLDIVEESVVY